MQIKDLIKNYFAILKNEEIDSLFSILDPDAVMSTPFDGILQGHESIKDFVVIQREWLLNQNAKLDIINTLDSEQRLIFEFNLSISSHDILMNLPFCVALDIADGMVCSIRLYYNTKPIMGGHFGIKPILESSLQQEIPDNISRFLSALGKGDIDQLLSLFEPDAVVQESTSVEQNHQGRDDVKTIFSAICKNGGVILDPCSVTINKSLIAVEHRFSSWKEKSFDVQAGMFIVDMGSNGKIAGIRFYDDV